MLLRRRFEFPAELAGTDLAAVVPEAELAVIARRGTTVTVGMGKNVMGEDTFGREFLIVLNGRLSVTRDGEDLAVLTAGDIAGEIALLGKARRTASVSAQVDTKVLAFNRREFSSVLDECPAFANFVIATAEARDQAA
jgi:CRP-like cAMP-binding protein